MEKKTSLRVVRQFIIVSSTLLAFNITLMVGKADLGTEKPKRVVIPPGLLELGLSWCNEGISLLTDRGRVIHCT